MTAKPFNKFFHQVPQASDALVAFLRTIAPHTTGSIVTIGNFDGCHLGHQSLITSARSMATAAQLPALALSFSPRPEGFFKKCTPETLLFTEAQKSRAFAELGLDAQVIQQFDERFAQLSAEDFYRDYLQVGLQAKGLAVGENFRFGKDRAGHAAFLQTHGTADKLLINIGQPARDGDLQIISSTRIRSVLQNRGDVAEATKMLGRPYMLEGVIKRGDQLGRQLGVPTANLEGVHQILPAYGVYAGYVFFATQQNPVVPVTYLPEPKIKAVFSIGIRPTLQQSSPKTRVEAHLLTGRYGDNDLYDLPAGYYLSQRLRGEERFATLAELKTQMRLDIEKADKLLG